MKPQILAQAAEAIIYKTDKISHEHKFKGRLSEGNHWCPRKLNASRMQILDGSENQKIFCVKKPEVSYVIKDRISKGYRISEIDEKLRKSRTKSEAKIIEKANNFIPVPRILKTDKFQIEMEFIDGKKLSENLDNFPEKRQFEVCEQIGENTAKLHDNNIIHGDLTTSNMILVNECKENKVYFIDFGLSFISHRAEDKAVDLHLLKRH